MNSGYPVYCGCTGGVHIKGTSYCDRPKNEPLKCGPPLSVFQIYRMVK